MNTEPQSKLSESFNLDDEEVKSILDSDISDTKRMTQSQMKSGFQNEIIPKKDGLKQKAIASGFIKPPQSSREKGIIFKCIKNFLKKNDLEEIFEKMQQESEPVRQDEEEGSQACQERKDQEEQAAKSDPYEMIYNTMEFEDMEKGDFVMKFGEHGTKFYIVLRGNVAVRVPSIVERDFTFQELLVLLVNDHEWIIQNDKYQEVMVLIQGIIPDLVFEDYRKNLQLDIDTTKRVLRGKIISYIQHNYPDGIPKFKDFNDFYSKF